MGEEKVEGSETGVLKAGLGGLGKLVGGGAWRLEEGSRVWWALRSRCCRGGAGGCILLQVGTGRSM